MCHNRFAVAAVPAIKGQSFGGQLLRCSVDFVFGGLILQPLQKLLHARLHGVLWFKPQQIPCFGDICKTVTNVSDAVLAGDLRLDMRLIHQPAYILGDLPDGICSTASYVENFARRSLRLEGQPAGTGDIMDMDEISSLLSVCEDKGWFIIYIARAENGQHSCIGV